MGRGIALAFAYAGHDVALVDLKPRATRPGQRLRDEAMAEMAASLAMLAELGAGCRRSGRAIAARIRWSPTPTPPPLWPQAEVVFEGVPETLDAKREAFDAHLHARRAEAILASTTSPSWSPTCCRSSRTRSGC